MEDKMRPLHKVALRRREKTVDKRKVRTRVSCLQLTETLERFKAIVRLVGFRRKISGFTKRKISPRLCWVAFKVFAKQPVICEREGLLVEYGNFYPGENMFHFTLVREFWFKENDEEYCEQLHCDCVCPPNEILPHKQTYFWSHNFPSVEAFFQAMESQSEFKHIMNHPEKHWQCEISQYGQ